MFRVCLIGAVAALASGSCPAYPNGTATQLNIFNCNAAAAIQVLEAWVTDDHNVSHYPISVRKPIVVHARSFNSGPVINSQSVDVSLATWVHGWLGCRWLTIPTFGLLNNIDGCAVGGNCPVPHGPLVLRTAVDISRYGTILALLAGGRAYQLKIHVKNNDTAAQTEASCIQVQGQLSK